MATIVLVPGSFSPAELYTLQTDSFTRHGLSSVVVCLPSVGRRTGGLAPGTMSDDTNEIVRVVESLLAEDKKVVLLSHSYGGIPTTQSLKRLSSKARAAQGKHGGVDTVIYMTSVVVPVGVANFDTFQGKLPDWLTVNDDYMELDSTMDLNIAFSDLSPEESRKWSNLMSCHSTSSFKEKLTYAGYNDVDVHYILCEGDQIIPPEAQGQMIEMVKATSGKDVIVHKLDCSHAPNISRPDDISRIAKAVVESV